jgi:hypothetical protein
MASVHLIHGQQEINMICCAINVAWMPFVTSRVLWNIEEYTYKHDFKLQQQMSYFAV